MIASERPPPSVICAIDILICKFVAMSNVLLVPAATHGLRGCIFGTANNATVLLLSC
jgi:hypothetical protein